MSDLNGKEPMSGSIGRGLVAGWLAMASVIAGLLVLNVSQALANHVQCGDTITQDTTLDSDLLDCPPDEPPRSGTALTIGADGVTLDLNGHTLSSNIPAHGAGTVGVDNGAGYDDVTVENGTIGGYEFPVVARGDRNLVTDANVYGRLGIALSGTDSAITRSAVGGGFYGAIGLGPGRLVVERNVLRYGGRCGICPYPFGDLGPGVVSVRRNTVQAELCAICLPLSAESAIERNLVTGVPYGVGSTGIRASGEGLVARNRVERVAIGIAALESVTLTRNTANDNVNLGIEAEPSVIDGGGNRAKGNGNPLQCLNVFCR